MYIRRKVYSAIQNSNGKVRLFSTTEVSQKSLAEKEMSDEEFEKKEKEVIKNYKKSLGHAGAAGINAAVLAPLAKKLLKKGGIKNNKLAAAGVAVTAANAGYHLSKSGKSFKDARKIGNDPRYKKKLGKVLDKEWGTDEESKKK